MKRSLREICDSWHFDPRIEWEYRSDVVYVTDLCALIDVDNTLTRHHRLYENYIAYLRKKPPIKRHASKIDKALEDFRNNPWNVKNTFDRIFLGILKKAPLSERLHKDACLYAADQTAPPPRTRELMFDLRDRGVTRIVATYCVEDALVPWYHYRISVLPVHLIGIKLNFVSGYLDSYDMGGPYGKVSRSMETIKKYGFSPDRVFAIDDDPVIDRVMAVMLGVGLIIWLDKNKERREKMAKGLYEYPGKFPIVLLGAEKNMQLITPYVNKLKRSIFVSETKTAADIYKINKEFKKMKHHLGLCKRDKKRIRIHMPNLLNSGERIVNIGYPFIATILSGVDDLFSELKVGFHTDAEPNELITTADELCSLLEKQNPELQLTEDYLEELLHFPS